MSVLGLRFSGGLSLVAASGGHSSSWCTGLSLSRPLLLRSTGSRRAGSVVVAHGPSCSVPRVSLIPPISRQSLPGLLSSGFTVTGEFIQLFPL